MLIKFVVDLRKVVDSSPTIDAVLIGEDEPQSFGSEC